MRKRLVLLSLLVAAILTGLATAQNPFPARFYYAGDYAYSITGQQANTYTFFPISLCNVPSGQAGTFFPFATNAPVYIQDAISTNNETLTPSAIIQTSAQCGVTISPANSHSSFTIRSATGGLQELLNTLPSTLAQPVVVYLDRNWYQQVAGVAGTVSTIIAAAKGNTQVNIIDITTLPFTKYAWNGASYTKTSLGAGGQFYGFKPSSLTVISPPTALDNATTLVNTATGGTIAAGAYRGGITYVDALGGETLLSTDSAAGEVTTTTGTTSAIQVTKPAAATGAVGYRVYLSADTGGTGTEVFYNPTAAGCTQSTQTWLAACAMSSNANITALVTGTSKVPSQATAHPTAITASSSALEVFQTEFGPFTDTSTQSASSSYVAAEFAAPSSVFNTLSKKVAICGTIEATAVNTAVPTFSLTAANSRGQSANTLVTFTPGALTGAAYTTNFCVNIKTAATGASATAEVHGTATEALASSGVPPSGGTVTDKNTGTVTFADLTKSTVHFQIVSSPTTAGFSAYVVRDLSIKLLN